MNSNRKTLLCLHGALSSKKIFEPWVPFLEKTFDLHFLDFEGHGQTSQQNKRPFRMETFAQNILDYLEKKSLTNVHIFGYSMGGYAALLLALETPQRLGQIMTLGTKFFWTKEEGHKEAQKLNPEVLEKKVPAFVANLISHHGEDQWKTVLEKTAEFLAHLGENDLLSPEKLQKVSLPIRICVGDRDHMSGVEASYRAFKALPQGEFSVLPQTGHPLENLDIPRFTAQMRDYFPLNLD